MTDNEIIKALECCSEKNCKNCPCFDENIECGENLIKHVLDLINRLQAEIERLQKAGEEAVSCFNRMESLYKIKCVEIDEMRRRKNATIERLKDKLFLALHTDTAKRNIEAEAVKRFAERVLKIVTLRGRQKDYFDNLVKEMTEQSVNYGPSKTEGNG